MVSTAFPVDLCPRACHFADLNFAESLFSALLPDRPRSALYKRLVGLYPLAADRARIGDVCRAGSWLA